MDEITRLEKDSILYYQGGGADIAEAEVYGKYGTGHGNCLSNQNILESKS